MGFMAMMRGLFGGLLAGFWRVFGGFLAMQRLRLAPFAQRQ
jgi:hypothetical protein